MGGRNWGKSRDGIDALPNIILHVTPKLPRGPFYVGRRRRAREAGLSEARKSSATDSASTRTSARAGRRWPLAPVCSSSDTQF